MKHFKTPKGTELPLMDIRGKDYLQVAHRLVWFREDHPTWSIITEYIELAENHAIARAQIKEGENIIATAHKHENRKGFQDFIEKAETGAIGRALAACGYGTQFAPELEEGERLADSPVTPVRQLAVKPNDTAEELITSKIGGIQDGITDKQQKRLYAISKECNWTREDVVSYLSKLGLNHSSELNYVQYDALIKNMQTFPKG